MFRSPLLSTTMLALALFAAPAIAQDASKPVARVEGQTITEEDVRIALDELSPTLPQQLDAAQRRTYAIDYLIDLKIVASQAAKENLADTADFKKRLDQTRDRLLMEAILTREGDKGSSDEAMKKFYDETVKGLKPAQEVARVISSWRPRPRPRLR